MLTKIEEKSIQMFALGTKYLAIGLGTYMYQMVKFVKKTVKQLMVYRHIDFGKLVRI